MTNFEKIKAKSIEDMALWIMCPYFLHITYNPELDKMYVERFQDWKHPD